MNDEWFIKTLTRNAELSAELGEFWNPELQIFYRDDEKSGLYFGIIPQLFNLKVIVGKIEDKDFCYDDGY